MPDSTAHFNHVNLPVRVPRGQDGYWQIICSLADSKRDFTINDIDDSSNVGRGAISDYVWSLHKAGYLSMVKRGAPNHVSAVFRLVKRQRTAPRVRRDGSAIASDAQEQLWTAIRTMKRFSLAELVFAASTPQVAIGYETAKRFVCRLATAGYLVVQPNGRKSVYRLKPSMDTGPKPPQARKVEDILMWDPNRKAFVGPASIASEVRP